MCTAAAWDSCGVRRAGSGVGGMAGGQSMEPDPVPAGPGAALARVRGVVLQARTAAEAVARSVEVAQELIPMAARAGIPVVDQDRTCTTVAATAPVVAQADALQHGLGEGPCLRAWDTVGVQYVPDTATGPAVAGLGPDPGRGRHPLRTERPTELAHRPGAALLRVERTHLRAQRWSTDFQGAVAAPGPDRTRRGRAHGCPPALRGRRRPPGRLRPLVLGGPSRDGSVPPAQHRGNRLSPPRRCRSRRGPRRTGPVAGACGRSARWPRAPAGPAGKAAG